MFPGSEINSVNLGNTPGTWEVLEISKEKTKLNIIQLKLEQIREEYFKYSIDRFRINRF